MEIRLKYINQDSFYGSDYFIKRVGYEEKWDRVKRLGDTYYENELLERSVTEKYGSNLKIGKVENTAGAIGTIAEEQSHVIGKFEGRQQVVPDGSEKGLESLGRAANEYVKKKFGKDNNSKIKLTTDGIDLSNADVGEKVGDSKGIAKIKGLAMGPNGTFGFLSMNKKISENMNETPTVYNYINGEAMVKIFEGQENVINKTLAEENYNISSEKVHEELRKNS